MSDLPKSTRGFFFIRHGQTTANAAGIACGSEQDPTLTPVGEAQSRTVAQAIATTTNPGALQKLQVVVSPMVRTQTTANIICEHLQIVKYCVHIENDLAERKLGKWNGKPINKIQPLISKGNTPPNGESNSVFRKRILDSLNKLSPLYAGWPLIVGSRGVGRIILEQGKDANPTYLQNCELLKITIADAPAFTITRCERISANN